MEEPKTIESIRVLLHEIVDYAGLFPPSQLSMTAAVANYAAYLDSNFSWLLGRFVVPVMRLDECAEYAERYSDKSGKIWRLSVLAGDEIEETIAKLAAFNEKFAGKAVADALEVKAHDADEIENIAAHLPADLPVYFELPLDEKLADSITALAVYGHRAKIRTGGITPEAFPPMRKIVRFMQICLAANVPFKCTAGLHHPLRSMRPLTYEADAPKAKMNGFLNVFIAAAFLRQNYAPSLVQEILSDERRDNFQFRADGVLWKQEHFVHTTQLKSLRERVISFGSCSFTEPIEDLQELGLL